MGSVTIESEWQTKTATIAAGATGLSTSVDTTGMTMWGIVIGSTWVSAGIDFYVSNDNTTFVPLYDANEVRVNIPAVSASSAYADESLMLKLSPWRYIKFRSATAGSAVNQTGGATIGVSYKG